MIRQENFRFPAAFAALSGVLHLAGPVVSGFASESWMLVPFGLVLLLIAYGLFMGWRWLAWVAFFWIFAGIVGALTNIWSPSPVLGWLFMGILAANLVAVLGLFFGLWRSPPVTEDV